MLVDTNIAERHVKSIQTALLIKIKQVRLCEKYTNEIHNINGSFASILGPE